MPRTARFLLPRRGELRYALVRAAAVLSSLLLLAAATPLADEPFVQGNTLAVPFARDPVLFVNAEPASVDISDVVHPAEQDVHIQITASPSASATPSNSVVPGISSAPSASAAAQTTDAMSGNQDHVIIDAASTNGSAGSSSSAQTAADGTPAALQTTMPASASVSPLVEDHNRTSDAALGSVSMTSNSAQAGAAPTKTPAPSVATAAGTNTTAIASIAPPTTASQDNITSFVPNTGDLIPEPSPLLIDLEPIVTTAPTGLDGPIIAELPSPGPMSPSTSPSPSISSTVQPTPSSSSSPPAPSPSATATAIPSAVVSPSASPSAPASAPMDPSTASGIQELPSPRAGQKIVVFPIILRKRGSRTVSKALDRCIRNLAAKRTESTPGEWALVRVSGGTSPDEIEAQYAMSFAKDDAASVKEFETYVEQSMSKDIANNCNINNVSIVRARSIIAAVGVAPDVKADGVNTKVALAASFGTIALIAILGGVLALIYGRRRHVDDSSPAESYTTSHDPSLPYTRPGLRFSSSRDAGPGPHTLVEAMGGMPIREIPVSDEGETVTSNTYTAGYEDGGSTSIYEDDQNSRELDFVNEGPSQHSLQAFTGAWGALAETGRQVSEPEDEVDDDGNDADYEEEVADGEESSNSSSGFGDGGHPEPPSSNSVNLFPGVDAFGGVVGASESFGHPHDYLIGIGPTSGSTPVPGADYIVPDLGEQD